MTINFAPKTRLGRFSVGLISAFFLLFILVQLLIASGQRGGETFFDNLWLSIPVLVEAICGISAFFTGIIGILRQKERAISVFLATVIGFFVLWFVLGEILVPH